MVRKLSFGIVLLAYVLVAIKPASADQYRYMDNSGNINFVDSINQVPAKYREQVIPPTPVPVYDKKTEALMKRMQREAEVKRLRAERERQRQEMLKKRERLREEREREKEEKRREKEARRERRSRPSATKQED